MNYQLLKFFGMELIMQSYVSPQKTYRTCVATLFLVVFDLHVYHLQ